MISLTKKEEKLIRSLQNKKYREQEKLFFVEGEKMAKEAIDSSFEIHFIVITQKFLNTCGFEHEAKLCDEITMKKISAFKTPPGILAVLKIPQKKSTHVDSDITLLIDKIQDPGNLGTIIRTADALGVKSIVCSEDTVDQLSPKVVQASMGSIFSMSILKISLQQYLENNKMNSTVYAAHLNGEDIYENELQVPAILIVGNESKGINDELLQYVDQKIKIPISGAAESFNVSIANAIILAEFRRRLS